MPYFSKKQIDWLTAYLFAALFTFGLTTNLQSQDTTAFLTTSTTSLCLGDTATINAGTVGADYGDGSDGALTVNSGTSYTDAVRTSVTGTNAAGGNTLTVASTSGFAVGDEIIIITMVDAATSGNTVGRHEFNKITAISGNTLTLAAIRTFAFNASGTNIHQAIKVPNYTNVSISSGATLTCAAWNGSTGGVLCFRANGTLTNSGTITSSGKGYRGVGHTALWRNKDGAQGEGIYGTGYAGGNSSGSNSITWNGANGNGGGGGTGRQDSGGGAGGGYASNGTNGNNSGGHLGGTGGLSVGTPNLDLLIMGGAGGEGGGDEDGALAGYGGNGGGIIYISASITQNAGTITCNGNNGGNGTNSGGGSGSGMGGGGGGAGGSIKLISVFNGAGTITSLGGNGGTNNGGGGVGGAGSVGRIALASTISSYPTTNPVSATASLAVITGSSFAWSNGDTTSFLQVSPSNTTTYTVTITNGSWSDTLSTEIYVFGMPNMPAAITDIEHCAGTFTFNTTTDSLVQTVWYDSIGGTPIYYGNDFTTPFLNDTTTYYFTSEYVTYTPPADAVDNSMQLALGLRLLVSDYEGKAVILRKSATANDTASFGFNFLGQLDIDAIDAWAGSGSTLWVHTIFDQSGNGRNLLNTNTAQQPQLILNGENGKPVLRFVTGTFLRYTTNDIVYPMSIITAAKLTTNSCGRVFGAANNYIFAFYSNQVNRHHFNTWVSNSSTNMVPANSADTWIHSSMSASNTSHRFFDNGNEWPANTINNANSQPPNGFQLNGYAANNETSNVDIMEVFIFNDVITDTEREYIEGRIASQYDWQTAGGQVVDAAAPCLLSNPNIDSVTAIVTAPSFGISLDTITANCGADSILIDAGSGWQTYSWSNLDSTQICTARYSGKYKVVVNDGACDVTDSVFVSLPKPALDDFTMCNGDTITAGYLNLGGYATGGILDTIGQEAVHKFLTDGTLVFPSTTQVRALIVGGGGGGGMDMGGGGGAGGFIDTTFILSAGTYDISVGQGGSGAPAAGTFGQPTGHQYSIPANNGGNSSIANLITAFGGGAGGTSYWNSTPGADGSNGGSGGGCSGYNAPNGSGAGLGIPGQGNRGGHGGGSHYSGGGGGAGSEGSGGPNAGSYNSNGGDGLPSDILGTTYYFAGGGGGSGYSVVGGNGGIGGGGGGAVGTTTGGAGLNNGSPGGGGNTNSQTNKPGGDAGANTGGGGGGGSHYNSNNKGGDGGSGIVVIRYTPILNYQFLWSTGDTTATINVSPSQTTDYYVTITDGVSVCYDTMTVFVNVPVYAFSSDTLTYCGADTATLDAGTGWSNYAWSTGDSTQLFTTTTGGIYHLTVTNEYGCTVSDSVSVGVINSILLQGDTTFCVGDTGTIGFGAGAISNLTQAGFKLALGLRLINENYTGNAVELRRSLDNAVADFGFVNGELDLAAISAWAGTSTIYVRTLYDQSGNSRDVVQATNSRQPTLILNSSYGAPVMNFTTAQQLQYTVNYEFLKPFTLVTAAKTTSSANGRVFGAYHHNWLHGFWSNLINVAHYDGWKVYPGIASSGGWQEPYIHTMLAYDQTDWDFFSNGIVQPKSNADAGTNPRGFTLNGSGNMSELSNVDIMEVIIFDDTLSIQDLQSIESSIANRFDFGTSYSATGSSGGSGAYSYSWSNGDTTNTIDVSPNSTTTYYVTISDGFAECYDSITVTVINPNFTFSNDTILSCGSDTINVSAGSTWDNYLWSNGDTTETTSITSSGVYTLTVSNNGQCETWDTVTVSVINANNGSNDTIICIGDSTTLAASQSQSEAYRNVLNFDGSNDYGQISRTIQNDFSIEYWVKTTQTGGGGPGTQWYGGRGIVDAEVGGVTNDFGTSLVGNKLCFGTGSPDISIQSTTAINDGQWHHVAVTREQSIGRLKIYIDGNLETTHTGASSASLSVPTNIKLGSIQTGGNKFFGSIADLRIWNTVRSASEIASSKNTQLNGTETGLLEYYPLLEGSGTSSADLAGNNQTLTLYNGVGWSNEALYIGNSLYNYTWSTGDTIQTINVSPTSTTSYTVTVSDGISSCIDTITVSVNDPNFTFSNDTILSCGADSVIVSAGSTWSNYLWSNGDTTQTTAITSSGEYYLTVTDNGLCQSQDTIVVSVINTSNGTSDTTICIGDSISINSQIFVSSDTIEFNYTGTDQIFVVPNGVTSINVVAWGAGGGKGGYSASYAGGSGGFASGTIEVTPGQQLKVVVGQGGIGQGVGSFTSGGSATYGGGGYGTYGDASGASGGGLTGLFLGAAPMTFDASGQSRAILIAGGGGGSCAYSGGGGAGGGTNAGETTGGNGATSNAAGTGTNGEDGSPLKGGNGDITGFQNSGGPDGGGGGGGYFGGEGGYSDAKPGGGGSGFLHPTLVSSGVTTTGQNGPSNTSAIPPSTSHALYNTGIGYGAYSSSGSNGGNGKLVISYIGQLGTGPSYAWSNGDTTASINVSPTSTTSYTVTVSDGISSCIDTITVSVNDPNFTFSNDTILANCFTDSVTVDAGSGWTGYNWSTGETTQTKAFTTTGTYTITVTDNGDCTSSDTVTVSVINPVLAQGDTMICINTSATVGYNALTNISYLWSNSGTSPSISVSPVVNSNYTVEIADLAQSCFDTITVFIDTLAPTAIPVSNLNVYLNNFGQATANATDANSATTDNCSLGSFSLSNTIFTCSDLGSNTVMFYATDNNSNIDSASMTITVIDTVSPVVATQNISIYLDANGAASIAANDIDNGSTDNCSIASMTVLPNSFTCADSNSNTVTLTVTDSSGNSSTGTATVTVLDTLSPIALAQNITVYLDANGNANITGADVNNGSGDNCAIASMTVSPNTFSCADSNANTVTFTVTDVSGNSSTANATVTVLDTVSPTVITQNISVNLDANGNASIVASDVNNGSTDNCAIASMSVFPSTFTCAEINTNTVTLTVTDVSGNSASATATVTITDIIAPTVTTQNITAYLDANGSATILAADVNNGSTDNCAIATMSVTPNSFSCADTISNSVTLTVTDNSGNSNTGTATVTIVDTISPTVVTQNISVYLDAFGSVNIAAADVNNGSSDNCAIANLSVAPSNFNCANLGENTVVLTATDVSGNSATALATVTVIDAIQPQVTTQNITVYLAGLGTASIVPSQVDNGSTDNCAIASYSVAPNSFSCADTGMNVVTLTVTDSSGNAATATANVIVLDTILPVVIAQNAMAYLDNNGQITITTADVDGGSSSSCSVSSFTVTPNTFNCADTGNNLVTLTMISGSGISSSDTATVTVIDTIAPNVLTQDITVYLDVNGNASIAVADINAGSTDNCAIATMALLPNVFNCTNIGANTVTLTVTDVSGNMNSATAIVTILDTISPIVATQNISIYLDANGAASIGANDVDNGSTDNCSIATMAVSPNSFTCADSNSNTVTLTVTDSSGNTSTATAVVTVLDTISPLASAQNITIYLDANGNASVTGADVNNGSTDNCAIATMTVSPNTFTCADSNANTVTFTVTDVSGNSSTASATVTVLDTISPTVITQNISLNLDANGSVSILASDVNNGSTDNCGIASISVSPNTFTCADSNANTVILTVTDISGNSASAAATVTITDIIAPAVITQNITAYLDANGSASILAADVNNGSTDNCAIASMSVSPNTFTCADSNSNTVTLTVTDVSGNSNTATALVNVVDTISPTVITQNVSVYLDASGNASITTADVNNGSSDNCAIANLSVFPSTFSCANLSGDTVALTATDVSGNSATAFAIVTVIDTISPQVSAQNITVYLAGLGTATLLPSDVDNGSTDNCAITNYSVSPNNFGCADTGLNVVTLTVTDASGNSASTIANVIILDTLLPNVVAQNATVYLDSTGQVVITTATVDGGSSSSCSLSSFTVSPDTFTCADTGNNIVTLTMVSGSGVTSSETAIVSVLDTIAPIVSTQNVLVYLDASGNATISVTDVDSGSSDNCAIATIAVLPNTFSCADTGANTVTLTITDVSGNVNSETAIVTVLDTIVPVALAQDINLYLDLNGAATLQATDIDNGSYDNCSIASMSVSADSFTCAEIGTNTVTLTVIDQNGLTATANALVTVVDTINPTLSVQNVSVYLDLVGTASINLSDIDNGSFDNCSIASISLSNSLFDCQNVGTNNIYLIGIDASGNMDSALAIVTVLDTIRPAITAQDYQVYLDEEGLATVTTTDVNAVSNDNCTIDSTYLTQTNFTCSDLGINSVLVYTRDASGNLDSIAINIEVLDTIAPVIVACSENIDACESLVLYDLPEAIDNCALFETTLLKGLESGSNFELGTTEIQYAFSDSSGNVSYCNFTVTVNSLPTLELTGDTTISSGESIQLLALSNTDVIFDWTPSNFLDDATSSNPVSTPTESITYTVFATSDKGCTQQDSLHITVEETLREITIYNAFSPNNDGKNDFLEIIGLEYYSDSKVLIVNRFGAKVFESKGYDNPWDGTYNGNDLPIGPYFYFIETGVEGAETLTGEISLIR